MIVNRKVREKALEVVDGVRCTLADLLAAGLALRRAVGPLHVELCEALAAAVRAASGLGAVLNQSLEKEVYETEEGEGQGEPSAAAARAERVILDIAGGGSAPRRGLGGDDSGSDGGADGS